jgi:hypothetical protein
MDSTTAKALLNGQVDGLQLMAADQISTASLRLGILKVTPMHIYEYQSTECSARWYQTERLKPDPPELILIREFDALFLQSLPEGV